MKKILQLLSLLLILTFSISCEDDPADFLDGTEWTAEIQPDNWYEYIVFGENTFDIDEYCTYHYLDKSECKRERIGSGTYVCNESMVILMVDGVVRCEGIIANGRMLIRDGDSRGTEFVKQ